MVAKKTAAKQSPAGAGDPGSAGSPAGAAGKRRTTAPARASRKRAPAGDSAESGEAPSGAALSGAAEEAAPAAKKTAKKAVAKKAVAKKAVAKKAAAAKPVAEGAAADKAVAKKVAAKKAVAKKAAKKAVAAGAGAEKGAVGEAAGAGEGTVEKGVGRKAAAQTQTGARTVAAKKTAGGVTTVEDEAAVPPARAGDLAVRPGEEPWTPEEVAEARSDLQAEVLRLRSELAHSQEELTGLMRDSGDGAGQDEADTGTKNITREHELALAANAREMLEQTEHALERLDAGTYGLCEVCGKPIGKARMQAFPRATLCVEDKQKQERRG
ncbi:TraR/DksA family transcriptional regulator [Streptomyces sp. NPDC057854]|uniref:TraR/DksA family transcriptional regulator n=1 Tax=unclassified Streptomyces TaxID=2593676 RepID=UPI00369C34D2